MKHKGAPHNHHNKNTPNSGFNFNLNNFYEDWDHDGVMNGLDCFPLDKHRQDPFPTITKNNPYFKPSGMITSGPMQNVSIAPKPMAVTITPTPKVNVIPQTPLSNAVAAATSFFQSKPIQQLARDATTVRPEIKAAINTVASTAYNVAANTGKWVAGNAFPQPTYSSSVGSGPRYPNPTVFVPGPVPNTVVGVPLHSAAASQYSWGSTSANGPLIRYNPTTSEKMVKDRASEIKKEFRTERKEITPKMSGDNAWSNRQGIITAVGEKSAYKIGDNPMVGPNTPRMYVEQRLADKNVVASYNRGSMGQFVPSEIVQIDKNRMVGPRTPFNPNMNTPLTMANNTEIIPSQQINILGEKVYRPSGWPVGNSGSPPALNPGYTIDTSKPFIKEGALRDANTITKTTSGKIVNPYWNPVNQYTAKEILDRNMLTTNGGNVWQRDPTKMVAPQLAPGYKPDYASPTIPREAIVDPTLRFGRGKYIVNPYYIADKNVRANYPYK